MRTVILTALIMLSLGASVASAEFIAHSVPRESSDHYSWTVTNG